MSEANGNILKDIISFIFYPEFSGWFLIVKIVFMAISAFFLIFIILALIKTSWLKYLFLYDLFEFITYRPFGLKKMEKSWKKVVAKLDTGLESEYKLAIIEADNILNDTLKAMGFSGESLGQRLEKITPATITNIEEVKQAHQVRNDIIHDPNYKLSSDQAKKILLVFEKTFTNLGVF